MKRISGKYILLESGNLIHYALESTYDVFDETEKVLGQWEVTDFNSASKMIDDIDRMNYRNKLLYNSLVQYYIIVEWKKNFLEDKNNGR